MKISIIIIVSLILLLLIAIIRGLIIAFSADTPNNKSKRMISMSVMTLVICTALMFSILYLFFPNAIKDLLYENSTSNIITFGIFCFFYFLLSIFVYFKNWRHGLIILSLIWSIYLSIFGCKTIFNTLKYSTIHQEIVSKLPISIGILKIFTSLILLITSVYSL